jgi:hypothetical protein
VGGQTSYLPLEGVYAFHEDAERWKLRRYAAAVVAEDGGERVRSEFSESFVDVFPDRRVKKTRQHDDGQRAEQTCRIFLRTRILPTDDDVTQPCDVLFDPQGRGWSAPEVTDWDEARGGEVLLRRQGSLASSPFP